MAALPKHASLVQLRRLLRKLDRAHTSDESNCPACRLQRLALQLNEEVEGEVQQLAVPGLGPGSASVAMAIESVLTVMYALDVRGAEEQGRVTQAPAPGVVRDMVFGRYIVRYAAQAESVVVLRIWHEKENER